MNNPRDNEIRFKLLNLLKDEPKLTQREMKQKMGVSLGKVNYCISLLTQKGMIRIERFKNSSNKAAYLYRITPAGLKELTDLTWSYLKLRIKEYDQIKQEIQYLSEQIEQMDRKACDDSGLLDGLKRII
ncbi:MarR family EPS-associated transcriptional regulator [Desulfospira joergensenii]|uniref:MarR family EPS-associated transcriptional regulator n=1 Tax=Desulfospira joergensenii TaxID=53329 RepID=UPI0003B4A006|nr:MarR family EPS-associated transcriptional regulator [Desulfospira joergensenii]